MYNEALVPSDFVVPLKLETSRLRLRPLTIDDAEKDYDAVMSSVEHLQATMRGEDWPAGLTLKTNISELGWHETEFHLRTSFAYTVVALDESEVLGCVYIYPARKRDYDAQVWMWVRESTLAEGLDDHLYKAVKEWIDSLWPFERPAYPRREIALDTWRTLPT